MSGRPPFREAGCRTYHPAGRSPAGRLAGRGGRLPGASPRRVGRSPDAV